MRRLIALAALAAFPLLAAPVAANVQTVADDPELRGCDAMLWDPHMSWVELAREGEDGWITIEYEEGDYGFIRLTEDGRGQLAPGTWTATWYSESPDFPPYSETFTIDCPPPDEPLPENPDTTAVLAEAGPTQLPWLPETSTEPRTSESGPFSMIGVFIIALALARRALLERPRVRGT